MIETYRGVVYPNQLDHMEHMNIQWYAEKFDQELFSGSWKMDESPEETIKNAKDAFRQSMNRHQS